MERECRREGEEMDRERERGERDLFYELTMTSMIPV